MRMSKEEIAKIGHNLAKLLLLNYSDSRDIGMMLSVAVSTFLINAPDKYQFEDHKNTFLECISNTKYESEQRHVS